MSSYFSSLLKYRCSRPNSQVLIIWPIRVFGRPKMEKPAAIMWARMYARPAMWQKRRQKKNTDGSVLAPASELEVLHAHSDMNFKVRNYKYKIETSTKAG
jgi:hypothetical protein